MGEILTTISVNPPGIPGEAVEILTLVDTGSWFTVLDPSAVRDLELAPLERLRLATAGEEKVPGVVYEVDLAVESSRILRRHQVFVPDTALREPRVRHPVTGERLRPRGLLGSWTLQTGKFLVDFRTHAVSPARRASART